MLKDNRHYHVFVIEDNPGDFILIADYLEEQVEAPLITHAKNFKEAQQLFMAAKEKVDVILLDLSLPDKSGEELITETLQFCAECPVIILTGHSDVEFSIRSLSLGISDYLLKDDITANSLYKSVLYSIERKRSLTELAESQKRYSSLFQLSPLPMWVYDIETLAFLDVNNATTRVYGYSKEEFLNMTIRDIRPPEDIPLLEKAMEEVRRHDELYLSSYTRHQKKNGDIMLVQIQSNIIMYQGRKAEVLLANDLTELLQTQQSLREAYKNIVDIEEQERQRLAGEIHDGVAQNLVAMQLMFTSISMGVPSVQQHPHAKIFAETLDATIQECKEIVGNVRPKELIDNGLDAMLQNLLQKINAIGKLAISMQLNTSLDSCFEYNERFHLYRIIQENISNTLKYASAATASLVVFRTDQTVVISFTDNGKGIPEKAMQAESSFIGIKRRLAVLNASFEVMNLPEGGAKFTYTIPVNSTTGSAMN